MQVSMHNWMRAEPVETTIRRLAKYGYDSIEISYDSVELAPGAPGTAAVRKMLKDNGIRCYGSISLMFAGRDLIHADPAVRASSLDYLKKCVTMIKELEGQVMSIVPSEVGKVKAMASPEEEWQWAIEGLKQVHAHATSAGVRVALEPLNRFETNFLNRHDQALALAEAVAPDVGVCLDVYHMNQEDADMFKAIQHAGPKLYDLHVADNNRMACGMGSLNWERLLSTVKEMGYEGSLTVEFVPPIDRTPANPYKNALAAADATLTPDQLKFIEDHGSGVLSEEFYSWLVEESIKTLRKYM
ncbi:MAG: sugar phosphate isomerase/epimerase [Chloroflexales bacterium]|nr:sugar phosphate isomerase/epimerase [Chloroflexales bacterium]